MNPDNERISLFTHQPVPSELSKEPKPTPTPTGDYVLNVMPDNIAAVRAGQMDYDTLRAIHQEVLDEVSPMILSNASPDIALVTQLDLAFMLGAYLPTKKAAYDIVPPELLALLDYQSETFGIPNRMDYELIINVNTEEYQRSGLIRTFLQGEDGQHERDFYRGHYLSEAYINEAAQQLKAIATEELDTPTVRTLLEGALNNMTTLRKYMGAYTRMPEASFNGVLRPYLGSYPDDTRNASGAFMPSVQLAELALHAPTKEQISFIDESMRYFPRQSRDDIKTYKTKSILGFNIADMVKSGQLQLDKQDSATLDQLIEEFIKFRTVHLSVVRDKIPQAFVDNQGPKSRAQFATFGEPDILAEGAMGTADFNIINILVGGIYRLIKSKKNLKEDLEDLEA